MLYFPIVCNVCCSHKLKTFHLHHSAADAAMNKWSDIYEHNSNACRMLA